jgi:hypothetical protein
VRRVTIHARKAWLQGLSPKENRDVPPLDYALVHRMKADFPHLHVSINGGIATLAEAKAQLARDGRRDDRARGLSHARRYPRAARMRRSSARRAPGAPPRTRSSPCCPISRTHLASGGEAQPDHPAYAGPVRGPSRGAGRGSGCCRKVPIATARGRTWWNARWVRSRCAPPERAGAFPPPRGCARRTPATASWESPCRKSTTSCPCWA